MYSGDILVNGREVGDLSIAAIFIEKGHIETALNKGEEYSAILVELKQP